MCGFFILGLLALQGCHAQYYGINFNYSIDCSSLTSWSSTAVVIKNPNMYATPYWLPTNLIAFADKTSYVRMEEERKCSDLFSDQVKGAVFGGAAAPASGLSALGGIAPAPAPAPAPSDASLVTGDLYQYTPYDAKTTVSTRRLRDCCNTVPGLDGQELTMPGEVNRPPKAGCQGCFRGDNRFCSFRIWWFDTLLIKSRGLCRFCEQINCRTKCRDGQVSSTTAGILYQCVLLTLSWVAVCERLRDVLSGTIRTL
jgi:hypothetical protein